MSRLKNVGGLTPNVVVMLALATLSLVVGVAEATCSATSTPEGTYTSEVGRIMSDSDGASGWRYDKLDDCTWTVKCPAGKHFTVVDLRLRFAGADSNGNADVLNVTDVASGQTLKSFTGQNQDQFLFTTVEEVTVHFVSLTSGEDYGFTLHYACLASQCTARTTTGVLVDNKVLTNRSGKILSDPDGASNVLVLPNETCQFSIQCPAEMPNLAVYRYINLESPSQVSIAGVSYEGKAGQAWSFLGPAAGAAAVPVNFTSAVAATKTPLNFGYTLDYVCSPSNCTSNTSGTVFTAENGQFETDLDGADKSIYYAAGEKCGWTIRCPADKRTIVIGMEGRAGVGVNLTVVADMTKKVITQSVVTSGIDFFDKAAASTLAAGEDVKVHFDVENDASPTNYGVTFSYGCRSSMCGSDLAGSTLTSPAGELSPGLKSRTETLSFDGESCEWMVECPEGYRGGLSLQIFGQTRFDPVAVVDLDSGRTLVNKTFGYPIATKADNAPIDFFSASRFKVIYDATGASNSVTVRYQCLPKANCSSPNVTTITGDSGAILSDIDGIADDYQTPPGQQCEWSITCSTPSQYLALNSQEQFGGEYSVTTLNGSYTYLSPTDDHQLGTTVYIQASEAKVSATGTSSSSKDGGVLNWACTERRCPVANGMNFTSTAGTIKTDPDGSGTASRISPGESCSWGIQCPEGFDFVSFDAHCKLSAPQDSWKVFNGVTGAELVDLCENTATQFTRIPISVQRQSIAKATNLHLVWDVKGTKSVSGGASTSYECTKVTCTASQNTVTASEGSLRGNAQKRGEMCTQRIVCPGNEAYVTLLVSYKKKKSPVSFMIGDVELPDHQDSDLETERVLVRTVAGSVTVVYDTTEEEAEDYTANFMCTNQPCTAFQNKSLSGAVMSFGGSLGSPDTVRSPGIVETCTWTVTCPAADPFLLADVTFEDVSAGSTASVSLTTATGGSMIRNMTLPFSNVNERLDAKDGLVVAAGFTGGAAAIQSPFDVSVQASCTACSYAHTLFHSNPSGVKIQSDPDGEGYQSKSKAGESCFWHLQCTNGAKVWVSKVRGAVGLNTLNAYAATNATQHTMPNPVTMPLIASFSGEFTSFVYFFNESDVFLQFNSSEVSDGFSLIALCDDRGPCTDTTRSVDETTGQVTVKSDAVSKFPVGTCLDKITCPPGKPTVLLDMSFNLKAFSLSVIGNIGVSNSNRLLASVQEVASSSGSDADYHGVLTSPALFEVYSSSFQGSGDMFAVNYSCVERNICTANVPSGTMVDISSCPSHASSCQATHFVTKRIDAVGAERGERCAWDVQCPAGQVVKVMNTMKQRMGIDNLFIVLKFDVGIPKQSTWDMAQGDRSALLPQHNGTLYFSAGAEGNDPTPAISCSPSMCDADDKTWRTASSGMIYFGGNATARYSMNANCSFIIQCPAGNDRLEVIVDGKFNTGYDGPVLFDTLAVDSESSMGYNVVKLASKSVQVSWRGFRIDEEKLAFDDSTFVRMRFLSKEANYQDTAGTGARYECYNSAVPRTPAPATPVPQTPAPVGPPAPTSTVSTPSPQGQQTPSPGSSSTPQPPPNGTPAPGMQPGTPAPPGTPTPAGQATPTPQPPTPQPAGPISTPNPPSRFTPSPPWTPQPIQPRGPNSAPTDSGDSPTDGSYVGGIVGGIIGGIAIVGGVVAAVIVLAKKGVIGGASPSYSGFADVPALDDKMVRADEMTDIAPESERNFL